MAESLWSPGTPSGAGTATWRPSPAPAPVEAAGAPSAAHAGLGDVRPSYTLDDLTDQRSAHRELMGQVSRASRRVQFANSANVVLRELVLPGEFAACVVGMISTIATQALRRAIRSMGRFGLSALRLPACSLLCGHVSHIVILGTEKEMGRANTGGSIALVADEKPVIKCSEGESVRESMGQHRRVRSDGQESVASITQRTVPKPATIQVVRLFDLTPEPIHQAISRSLGKVLCVARMATKFCRLATVVSHSERLGAGLTGQGDRLMTHGEPPTRDAIPPVVPATRGLLVPNFTGLTSYGQ